MGKQTRISHSNPLSLRDWDKKVFLSARKRTFWDKLRGVDTSNGKAQKMVEDYEKKGRSLMTDSNSFMESRTLANGEGTEEIFKLQVVGDYADDTNWIMNDNLLENHEKNMEFASQSVVYDIHKFGVNRGGSKTKVETDIDLVASMHTQVSISTAERLDFLRFKACRATAYSNTASVSGSSVAVRIGALVDMAQTGKGIDKIIKPVKIGGEDYYVLGLSIADARVWRNSAEYGQAQREANERSAKNPIFTGALGIYENVIIMKHQDFEDGKSVLLGSQAMLELWGGDRVQQIVGTSKYGKIESESLGVFLSYGVDGAKFSDGKVHGMITAKVTP